MNKYNYLKKNLIFLLAIFVLVNCDSDFYELIFDSNYKAKNRNINYFNYHREIIINHEKVGTNNTGTLPTSGFPVCIDFGNDPLLRDTSNGGNVHSDQGYDIIFLDSERENQLHHEIERYNNSNGRLIVWVRIDSLSKELDTTIYMYYGNSDIASSVENPEQVWDSNYKGVWHFQDDFTIGISDSTGNNHNGTAGGDLDNSDRSTGKISTSVRFDVENKYIDFGDVDDFDFGTSNFTISFWAKGGDDGNEEPLLTKNLYFTLPSDGIYIYNFSSTYHYNFYYNETTNLFNDIYLDYTNTMNSDDWHHLIAVREGTGPDELSIYVDGQLKDSGTLSLSLSNDLRLMLHAWDDGAGGVELSTSADGDLRIDELRLSNSARSLDWIVSSFNNQNDITAGPANFIKSISGEL